MEFNPQNSDDIQGGPGQVRSFTCNFCKRGFSNAQALGGHMNIHRRDRAKLRQSCEENSLSLDISIKSNPTDHVPEKDHDHAVQRGKAIQLPLFAGRPTSSSEIRGGSSVVGERIEEKKTDQLDLELRLGLEPQEAPTLSTREFFWAIWL